MNNHINNSTQDYYSYNNNLYNQPSFDQNDAKISLYNPYQGYIRGNLFPNLYNPYRLATPFEIEPLNEQAELLTTINSLDFALVDLNLYLDIYSNDKKMIELYNQYHFQKNNLVDQYENKYGPLSTNSNALAKLPWAWNENPWPWER